MKSSAPATAVDMPIGPVKRRGRATSTVPRQNIWPKAAAVLRRNRLSTRTSSGIIAELCPRETAP
jgi:hypothetical protein